MVLKKLETEKYIRLVNPPTLGINIVEEIISPLQKYAIFKNVSQPSSLLMSVTEGEILSIRAYLVIGRLYDCEGKDLSVSARFIYVDGNSDEDLNLIRDVIKNAGLELFVD